MPKMKQKTKFKYLFFAKLKWIHFKYKYKKRVYAVRIYVNWIKVFVFFFFFWMKNYDSCWMNYMFMCNWREWWCCMICYWTSKPVWTFNFAKCLIKGWKVFWMHWLNVRVFEWGPERKFLKWKKGYSSIRLPTRCR